MQTINMYKFREGIPPGEDPVYVGKQKTPDYREEYRTAELLLVSWASDSANYGNEPVREYAFCFLTAAGVSSPYFAIYIPATYITDKGFPSVLEAITARYAKSAIVERMKDPNHAGQDYQFARHYGIPYLEHRANAMRLAEDRREKQRQEDERRQMELDAIEEAKAKAQAEQDAAEWEANTSPCIPPVIGKGIKVAVMFRHAQNLGLKLTLPEKKSFATCGDSILYWEDRQGDKVPVRVVGRYYKGFSATTAAKLFKRLLLETATAKQEV